MNTHDLIVIGAGPAGSSAAKAAALQGLKVLLLDKAVFPRDKLCAGGLTAKALPLLPADAAALIKNRVSECTITFRNSQRLCHAAQPQPCVYMFNRLELDNHLLRKAIEAGAVFRPATRVTGLDDHGDRVGIATADGQTFQAPWVIAADGANGIARRQLLPHDRYCHAMCLETTIPWDRADQHIVFNFGSIPGGYGWIFPKGDHASVGIGTSRKHLNAIRSYYTGFLNTAGIKYAVPHGFPLAVFNGNRRLTCHRVLFCGDAAHLVDPITGEGLYQALVSGTAAGRAAATADPAKTYRQEMNRQLLVELRHAKTIARFIFGLPGPSFAALEASPRIASAYIDVISGRKTYARLMGSGLQGPFRIMAKWLKGLRG